jgi:hypothetical protein
MPTEGREEEEIHDQIKNLTEHGLNIKAVRFPQQQIRIKAVVVDRKSSLVVDLRMTLKLLLVLVLLALLYIVLAGRRYCHMSQFDSFWEQSELYERVIEANEKLEQYDSLQREFIIFLLMSLECQCSRSSARQSLQNYH